VVLVAAYAALQRGPAPPAPEIAPVEPATPAPVPAPPPAADGSSPPRSAAPPAARLETQRAEPHADGTLTLRWQAVDGAEGYRVRIFSTEFEEVGRFEADAPELTLTQSDLKHLGLPRKTFLWRVAALAGGRIVSSSPVTTSQLP
jgi:hypothetical protein